MYRNANFVNFEYCRKNPEGRTKCGEKHNVNMRVLVASNNRWRYLMVRNEPL